MLIRYLIEGEGGGKDQLVFFEYIGIEYLMGSQVREMSNKYHPLPTRNFYAIPPHAVAIAFLERLRHNPFLWRPERRSYSAEALAQAPSGGHWNMVSKLCSLLISK